MRATLFEGITPNQVLINPIKNRVLRRNKNCNIIIDGEAGSGKSWAALSLAILLAPYFKQMLRPCCLFNFKDLINLVRAKTRSKAWFMKRGYLYIFDEIGTKEAAYNRAWFSASNQSMVELFQTYRHRNLIGLFTVPFKKLIDSQLINFFQYRIKMVDIHEDISMSEVKIYRLVRGEEKIYPYYLRDKNGVVYKSFLIPKPPQWMINEYEEMKTNFTSKLNKRLQDSMKTKKLNIKRFDVNKYVNKIMESVSFFINTRGTIDWLKVKEEFKLSEPKARTVSKYTNIKLNELNNKEVI